LESPRWIEGFSFFASALNAQEIADDKAEEKELSVATPRLIPVIARKRSLNGTSFATAT